jgi:hypothetical protein
VLLGNLYIVTISNYLIYRFTKKKKQKMGRDTVTFWWKSRVTWVNQATRAVSVSLRFHANRAYSIPMWWPLKKCRALLNRYLSDWITGLSWDSLSVPAFHILTGSSLDQLQKEVRIFRCFLVIIIQPHQWSKELREGLGGGDKGGISWAFERGVLNRGYRNIRIPKNMRKHVLGDLFRQRVHSWPTKRLNPGV